MFVPPAVTVSFTSVKSCWHQPARLPHLPSTNQTWAEENWTALYVGRWTEFAVLCTVDGDTFTDQDKVLLCSASRKRKCRDRKRLWTRDWGEVGNGNTKESGETFHFLSVFCQCCDTAHCGEEQLCFRHFCGRLRGAEQISQKNANINLADFYASSKTRTFVALHLECQWDDP